MTYLIIGIVLLLIIYVLIEYNGFVKINNRVKEAFSTMDVYLKKRWDLVPNLVEVVKGYAKHESNVLEEVTKLRSNTYSNMSTSDKLSTNEELTGALSKIMAVAENYPDLKANQNFSELAKELTKIEDDIANARKYYNAVVRKLNIKVEMFPSNIVGSIFGFKEAKMFEADTEEKNNVKVEL